VIAVLVAFIDALSLLLVDLKMALIALPPSESPSGAMTHLRVRDYSPAVEVMDQDGVMNWYMGIDDDDNDALAIGAGYGPRQGVPPSLTIDKVRKLVSVGENASRSQGGMLSVTSHDGYGQNDWVMWLRRHGQLGGGVSCHMRAQHFSGPRPPEVVLSGLVARGSLAAPAPVRRGDNLMIVDGRGYDGSGRDYTEYAPGWSDGQATVMLSATEDWSEGRHGAQASIYTTPNGTVQQIRRVTVEHDGTLAFAGVPMDNNGGIRVRRPDGSIGRIQT
jgi:hypothetical protein